VAYSLAEEFGRSDSRELEANNGRLHAYSMSNERINVEKKKRWAYHKI
jgi:hypothetical protein